jgi:uncharacterized protein YbjT (DUF2867 family)
MRIAVAGGTGTVGAHVVSAARAAGHDVIALSRAEGVDVRNGAGLDRALDGADAVVDALSIATPAGQESIDFFSTTTQHLLDAEVRAGVRHHVVLSIVGIDRAPYGYYAGKVAQERLVAGEAIPWTILRATQFHEFAAQMFARVKAGPVHLAPRMRTQPVAAREVGERLAALAAGEPVGRAADLAGPREESLVRMVRGYAAAIGWTGWLPAVSLPGPFGRAQRDGSLLPDASADLAQETFDEWLGAQHPAR